MIITLINLIAVLTLLPGQGAANPPVIEGGAGEEMHYKLRYSIFQVGVATVSCKEDRTGSIYHISVDARSNGLVKVFNNMHYRLECNVDPSTGLPDSAVINLKDRKHSLYNELYFYQDARPDSAMVRSKLSGEHIVSRNIYEILTGFYHFREELIASDKNPSQKVTIKTFYPDKPWELIFHYAEEEELNTALGSMLCYRYNPGTIAGRFFEREDAMSVWFTKEKPHFPVRFRLNLKIGAIHGVIVDYSKP
ncbi:MAG: DUF3108 domain-containing protein [Bacteroidota bacterium]